MTFYELLFKYIYLLEQFWWCIPKQLTYICKSWLINEDIRSGYDTEHNNTLLIRMKYIQESPENSAEWEEIHASTMTECQVLSNERRNALESSQILFTVFRTELCWTENRKWTHGMEYSPLQQGSGISQK